MPGWKTAVSLIAASVTLMGLSAPASARARADMEERPCPVAVPEGTTCGYLLVPERRDAYQSDTIKVGYAIRKAASPVGEPVVFMSGGPGSASIPLTEMITSIAPDRDVVVIEQRGGRWSEPRLECPEIVDGVLRDLAPPTAVTVTPSPSPGPITATPAPAPNGAMGLAARTCKARLTVDLRGYRTQEIAADVVELRRSLGYDKWTLFGVSYSTRAMLLAAAMDPEGAKSLVLDSYLPERSQWYDQAMAALRSTLNGLGVTDRFDLAVKNINAAPVTLATRDPLTRRRVMVRLTGDDVATLLAESFADPEALPILPALVDGLAGGHTDLLQPLVDGAGGSLTSHEWGLYYAVQCQDEAPANTFADRRLFTADNDATVCAEWRLPPSGEEGALTQAPVLILAGQYDPTTPSAAASQATENLPGARFQEFAGVGHGVFLSSECGRRTISAFLADPAAPAPCDAAVAPRAMIDPGSVHFTGAAYTAAGAPWVLAPLGAFALLSLFQLAGGALTVRRDGLLTLLAGITGVVFCAIATWSVLAVDDEVAFAVGIPPIIFWTSPLAVVSAGLSVVAAFRERAPGVLILPAATGLVFAAWLVGWVL
ncbi:alpha/beta hydrolase [Herbidospora galbida]|uniref:Alpha/beta hydrolase n=1 Tax=Herbidospora galbida TaxID=2575442 RepID=A0A4V5UYR0_9ACTN|nr:alpha/beta hydrolase [Herbidospora galbida]TKK85633.1 alpha/beta hydrolase [Herbidospora galbida]